MIRPDRRKAGFLAFRKLNGRVANMSVPFSMILAVAAGGALGAVGRFLVMSGIGRAFGHGFPIGTLAVNIIGSFLLGALLEVMALK